MTAVAAEGARRQAARVAETQQAAQVAETRRAARRVSEPAALRAALAQQEPSLRPTATWIPPTPKPRTPTMAPKTSPGQLWGTPPRRLCPETLSPFAPEPIRRGCTRRSPDKQANPSSSWQTPLLLAKLSCRDSCIRISGQSHIEVRGFRVQNCDGVGNHDGGGIVVRGIPNGPTITGIRVLNNHIYKTYSSAISAWGVPWKQDPGDFKRISDILVANNLIEYANDGGANEQITFANGVINFEIRNNELRNQVNPSMGGEGIDIKEGCAFGKIHHNLIHHVARRGIYIDGGGRSIYSAPTHDIDIYNNIVHHAPNGFALMSEGGEDVYNIRVANNLFYEISKNCAFIYDHPNAASSPGKFTNVEFVNNTFWDCGLHGLDLNSKHVTGLFVGNNLTSTYLDRFNLADESSNIVGGNPGFVKAGDYHLKANSPAIDAGSSKRAPSFDLDDKPRPKGKGYDVGAYEH